MFSGFPQQTIYWTPTLTMSGASDLVVVYSNRYGTCKIMGSVALINYMITTTTFTFTSSTGVLQVLGLPVVTPVVPGIRLVGAVVWGGITKANYTQVSSLYSNSLTPAAIQFLLSGSGQSAAWVTNAEVTSGTNISLQGSFMAFI